MIVWPPCIHFEDVFLPFTSGTLYTLRPSREAWLLFFTGEGPCLSPLETPVIRAAVAHAEIMFCFFIVACSPSLQEWRIPPRLALLRNSRAVFLCFVGGGPPWTQSLRQRPLLSKWIGSFPEAHPPGFRNHTLRNRPFLPRPLTPDASSCL